MSANIEVPANVSDAETLNGSTAAEIQAAAEAAATATAREQNIALTGFESFSGTGDYYSVTGNTLTLLRPATGIIDGIEVTCAAGQSADLVQYACTYFGFDADGVFGAVSDSSANEAWYRSHVSLFQALWDGTHFKVVFENHPPGTLQGDSAVYLHHVMRSVLGLAPGEVNEIGANITRVTTGSGGVATDRQLKIVGNAALYDHGVVSVISDTAGAAINPYFAYTDASGRWKAYAQQQSFPMVYNNAGTVTALGAGNYSIMAVYVTKNDPNDGATFIVVIGTGNYSNSGQAETALANNQVPKSTNELNRLEVALLGYVIVHNSGGGYIHTVQIEKQVAGAAGMGGGVGGSAALTLVSHTAVNYTADSQTVEGHITGIDTALGERVVVSGTPGAQQIAVWNGDGTQQGYRGFEFDGTNVVVPGLVDGRDIAADGNKLDGVEIGAQVNVNADWDATAGDALILNKPTIPSAASFNAVAVNADYTADDHDYVYVGTSTTTQTLPATPSDGFQVIYEVGNFADTVIAGNGQTIEDSTFDMTADVANSRFIMHHFSDGTAADWRVLPIGVKNV